MAGGHALLGGLDNLPFTEQDVVQGHFTWTLLIPDVASLPRELDQFGHGETLASCPTQCLLPHLALQDDGVSVEQMLFRPLHSIAAGTSVCHPMNLAWTGYRDG